MTGKGTLKTGCTIFSIGLLLILSFAIETAAASGYHTLTAKNFKKMLHHKDFFLLDVHIPEQKHIPGTDAFIDFRDIKNDRALLPADKETRIIVYCLGGGMSREAAHDLIDLGYTRVYDLLGGTQALQREFSHGGHR